MKLTLVRKGRLIQIRLVYILELKKGCLKTDPLAFHALLSFPSQLKVSYKLSLGKVKEKVYVGKKGLKCKEREKLSERNYY